VKFKRDQRDELFKEYVTNSLRLIPQSKYISKTYHELLTPEKEKTGEEIVIDIITRHGLKVRTEDE
jgi:hypothetical protein